MTPFDKAIKTGIVEIEGKGEGEEFYLCSVGHDYIFVNKNYDELCEKALSTPSKETIESVVFPLYFREELLTKKHKYFIYIQYPFFHLILDTLMSVLYIHDNDPDAVFVLYASEYTPQTPEEFEQSLEFLTEVFTLNSINFSFIGGSRKTSFNAGGFNIELPVYKAVNCTAVSVELTRRLSLPDRANLIEKYILSRYPVDLDESDKPERLKVYISRGGGNMAGESFKEPGNPRSGYADSSVRIYEENLIEEYLLSMGFFILKPSKDLSILDQILFMTRAAVLLGVTGTGLINSLFMYRGGTVIELSVELANNILLLGTELETTNVIDYWNLSQAKEHIYIGIDLIDKQGSTAVEKLKLLFEALDVDKL